MALKTFIKINSVNNLSDARYCAGMGVDVIGFAIDQQQERSVSKEEFEEIISWVSGPAYALEVAKVKYDFSDLEVQYIESSDINILSQFKKPKYKLILKTNLNSVNEIDFSKIDYLLIEGEGSLSNDDIVKLQGLSTKTKVLLGYGFDAQNVNDILSQTSIHGIAITSGNEIRPGYKDFDEMANLFEAIEIDEWA